MKLRAFSLTTVLVSPAFAGCADCIDCNRVLAVSYVHATVRDLGGPVEGVIVFAGQAHLVQQGISDAAGTVIFQVLDPVPNQLLGVTGKVPRGYATVDTSFVQLRDGDTVAVTVTLE